MTRDLFCVVKQERIDLLGTMHTTIARGNVLYKNQTCPALPQSARPVTEVTKEEEKDEEDKTKNSEICVRNNFACVERRKYVIAYKSLL